MIVYSHTGELMCCGEVMGSGISNRGDHIATCAKCNQSYETGSYRHNPTERRPQPAMIPDVRYAFGLANWIVKDGVKQEA